MSIAAEALSSNRAMERQPSHFAPDSDDNVRLFLNDINPIELLTAGQEVELAQSMEDGTLAQQAIDEGSKEALVVIDGLSHMAGHKGLSDLVSEGTLAREKFILANMRLVMHWAIKYQNQGLDLGDLIQEGMFGLMRAVDKFDWQKGFKFSTYGTWWIKRMILRGIENNGKSVRVPPAEQAKTDQMYKIIKERELRPNGRSINLSEIAEEMEVTLEKAQEYYAALRVQPVSLDMPIAEESYGLTLADAISDDKADLEREVVQNDLTNQVSIALKSLDEGERTLIIKHFGLDGSTPLTLKELAKQRNQSLRTIHNIERRALLKLKFCGEVGNGLRDFLKS